MSEVQQHVGLALLTDFYQLTMMGGYLASKKKHQQAVFDLYFRQVPNNGGYCVAGGLGPALDYLENLRFEAEDLKYLRRQKLFHQSFLDYLESFRFSGSVLAVEEGTPVFPGEPLLRVSAPMPQAQLVETALLNIINFQTLIATKAARICQAAAGGQVLEFGLRRAQGIDGGISAARAAYIGGCSATSNVLAGKLFDIPVRGTQAHSWVMSFGSELEAFRAYAHAYPQACALLVDTYNTLEIGVPNAILVAYEMEREGNRLQAIRLDSGDLAYLSKQSRAMLDAAGLDYVKILASGDLDEMLIHDLLAQGARIDVWGVGTRLITSEGAPALGGVYKLVAATDDDGHMKPRIKLSANPEKMTLPGIKQVWRLYDESDKMAGDVVALADETFEERRAIRTRHPAIHYQRRRFNRPARIEPLLTAVVVEGKRVYQSPPLAAIRDRTRRLLGALRDEHKRFTNPDVYWVGLSEKLFDLREQLIEKTVQEHPTPVT